MQILRGRPTLRRQVALAQGVYFALTGLWALVHIRSFMAVTGPKTDVWLVKTVGALVGVLGGVLTASAARGEPSDDLEATAVGSAAALAAVDVVYVARRRIAPVYLLDAVAEAVLIAGWAVARRMKAGPDGPAGSGTPPNPSQARRVRP